MLFEWRILAAVGLAVASSLTGWPLVSLILRASERRGPKSAATTAAEATLTSKAAAVELRGGLWIGLVERFACTLAIMFGQATLVAVIVAVKGLGRFKEITGPEVSERFVLGTLVSLTWASMFGLVGAAL